RQEDQVLLIVDGIGKAHVAATVIAAGGPPLRAWGSVLALNEIRIARGIGIEVVRVSSRVRAREAKSQGECGGAELLEERGSHIVRSLSFDTRFTRAQPTICAKTARDPRLPKPLDD